MDNKKERNKKIGIIAVMIALILLIACFGGTTFAKYITERDTGTQSATVAKWGYVVNADASGLFAEASKKGVQAKKADAGVDVAVETKGNVVAPGTKGELAFSIVGKAEVMSKIVITATSTKDVSLTAAVEGADDEKYYPIKWTLQESADGTTYANVTDAVDLKLADMVTKLGNLSDGTNIAPNTEVKKYYKLSWKWDFVATTDADKYNKYDTLLSEAASSGTTTVIDDKGTTDNTADDITYTMTTEIELSLKITMEQVQATA